MVTPLVKDHPMGIMEGFHTRRFKIQAAENFKTLLKASAGIMKGHLTEKTSMI